MSPEEKQARAEFLRKQMRAAELRSMASAKPPSAQEEKGFGDYAMDALQSSPVQLGFRTLDMPGGIVRTAYKGLQNIPRATAKGLEAIGVENEAVKEYAAKPHLVTQEDYELALQGRAPTMADFAEREGAKPGAATAVGGMAGDILLDPLTYMSLGTAPIAKQLSKQGTKLYKSGLKAVDIEAAKYGKEPVSDLLMKEGITGSAAQIQKKMDDLAAGYKVQRDSILQQATRSGAEVDMGEAMAPLLSKIDELEKSGDPNLVKAAAIMKKDAMTYLSKGAQEGQDLIRELPVGGKYIAPHTQLATIRGEGGKLIYKKTPTELETAGKLPSAADYLPPYREVKPGLPMGKVQEPVSTKLATDFRNWKKLKEMPDAILPGQAPVNTDELVKMGQIIPENTKYADEFAGFSETPGRTFGKTVPEEFIPQKPQTALDFGVIDPKTKQIVERIAGPTPTQASGWKSSTYNKIGGPAYEQLKQTGTGKQLLKEKGRGLKQATETAVGKTLGTGAKDELVELNKKLGQILTTQKKAFREAAKETNKNAVSSVDAPLAYINWKAAIAKKAADIAKGTKFRTTVGKSMVDKSKKDLLLEKNLLTSPWLELGRQEGRED